MRTSLLHGKLLRFLVLLALLGGCAKNEAPAPEAGKPEEQLQKQPGPAAFPRSQDLHAWHFQIDGVHVQVHQEKPAITVLIGDVGKYLKQADVPKRKGPVKFTSDGKITEKDGKKVIEVRYSGGINGFSLGYVLTGTLKADKLTKKELAVDDFAEIDIKYTDDLLEAKGLSEKDVKGLIEQLRDPANKVQWCGTIVPGGEMLEFSSPMKKLIILGEKARAPLQDCLGDQRIQNEVALILGTIGDEKTVSALISVYPDVDARKKADKLNDPGAMKVVSMTFALTYLTGQPIGRSRYGADFKPENGKLWKEWWAKEGQKFKVPSEKPNASWVPMYPILSEEWADHCREEFAKGEQPEQKPEPTEKKGKSKQKGIAPGTGQKAAVANTELPEGWNLAGIAKATHPVFSGDDHVLVWTICKKDDGTRVGEGCFVLSHLPDCGGEERWLLSKLYRGPKDEKWCLSMAHYMGVPPMLGHWELHSRSFGKRPSNKEVYACMDDFFWRFDEGENKMVETKFCTRTWEAVIKEKPTKEAYQRQRVQRLDKFRPKKARMWDPAGRRWIEMWNPPERRWIDLSR